MNPIKELIDSSGIACYRVADRAEITRGALYSLYNAPELPNCEVETLRKVAAVLGKMVKVTFEPIITLEPIPKRPAVPLVEESGND